MVILLLLASSCFFLRLLASSSFFFLLFLLFLSFESIRLVHSRTRPYCCAKVCLLSFLSSLVLCLSIKKDHSVNKPYTAQHTHTHTHTLKQQITCTCAEENSWSRTDSSTCVHSICVQQVYPKVFKLAVLSKRTYSSLDSMLEVMNRLPEVEKRNLCVLMIEAFLW